MNRSRSLPVEEEENTPGGRGEFVSLSFIPSPAALRSVLFLLFDNLPPSLAYFSSAEFPKRSSVTELVRISAFAPAVRSGLESFDKWPLFWIFRFETVIGYFR